MPRYLLHQASLIMRCPLLLVALACLASACSTTINTLPPVASANAPVRELMLEIPPGLEVRSATYTATMYSDVTGTSGSSGVTTTSVGGRAFVQVLAIDRASQEQVLLVYENLTDRRKPIQIIRFRAAAASGGAR